MAKSAGGIRLQRNGRRLASLGKRNSEYRALRERLNTALVGNGKRKPDPFMANQISNQMRDMERQAVESVGRRRR